MKRWRADEDDSYFYIDENGKIYSEYDQYLGNDDTMYNSYNYFQTEQQAKNAYCIVKQVLKLQHYHDVYCPSYVPDWSNLREQKWFIFFDELSKTYNYDSCYGINYTYGIFFESEEICKKICKDLNEEE